MELKQHPLSSAFPSMSEADYQALKDDIKSNGQREPVMVYEGMVLDGWHRYRACHELGVKAQQFTFRGNDPAAFVESANLHRRHLSASQRAIAVVAVRAWTPAGKPLEQAAKPNVATVATLAKTNAEMAKEAKVSPRTIRDAKTAQKAGLSEAVKEGAITVNEAAKIARGKPEKAAPVESFGPSEAEIAAAQRDQEEELATLRKIAEGDDKLKAALAEVTRLQALNRVLTERLNSMQNEKNAAIRAAKSWQRKAEAATA